MYLTVPAAADTLETWGFAMPIEDDNLSPEDTVRKSSDLAELQGGLAYQEVLNQIKRSRCRPLYMCLIGFWCSSVALFVSMMTGYLFSDHR